MRFILFLAACLMLSGCDRGSSDGPLSVALIGTPESPFQQGLRLSSAAQHIRAATNEGLVAMDASGQVVPAVAERWIVTDDGLSYIFRLRNSKWPGGGAISGNEVRNLLMESRRRLRGTSLGLDLAKIDDIRAMTGRVVEIRLKSPMPDFLRVLAQPELGFIYDGGGAGPMIMSRDGNIGLLSAMPPQSRAQPAREDWEDSARQVQVQAMPAKDAIAAFSSGDVDLVLDGRLAHLPLVDTGPLSRGTVRLDNVLGLFGLMVRNDKGLLGDPALREALSMAIDRDALMEPFGVGGWQPTTRIVGPLATGASDTVSERWTDMSVERRQEIARERISGWKRSRDAEAALTIGMADGPGNVRLFARLSRDFGAVGVKVTRLPPGAGADLELHERIARFGGARWFLDQFNCTLKIGLCSPEADAMVARSISTSGSDDRSELLAQAERELMADNVFIPFGPPIRWSLVRSNITGFESNVWGIHPLFPLSQPTI